jgi:SAM-dependent methyltransferase
MPGRDELDTVALSMVEAWLPCTPARILEVGCGDGELARALARAGHDVVAIDPDAPAGPIFRQVSVEQLDALESVDAVVAVVSLHHTHDPPAVAAKLAGLLRPGGRAIVLEMARELLDERTARWLHLQLLARAELGRRDPLPREYAAWRAELEAKLDGHGVHPWATVGAALRASFRVRHEQPATYLYRWGLDHEIEPLERCLVEEGAIAAIGVHFVGERRRRTSR